jgi:hypothetical protein
MTMHHYWRIRDGKIEHFRGSEDTEQTARILTPDLTPAPNPLRARPTLDLKRRRQDGETCRPHPPGARGPAPGETNHAA